MDSKKETIQESRPEVAYSPFHGDDDIKSYPRFTVIRKLRTFQKMAVVIGDVQSMVTFGSHIDAPVQQPIVEEDLRSITLLTVDRLQIHDNMGFINQFAGATVCPSPLMKIHSTMARETVKEVKEDDLKACQGVFETFFSSEKQRLLTDCVYCHDGDDMHVCTCDRDMRAYRDWNEGLRTAIQGAVLFEESEALNNFTEPTEVKLVTSLATLSMLASEKVMKDMVQGRKVYALSSENFEGQLKARDHSITNLRRTLADATGDSDESFRFEDDDYDIKLTQDEVVKTIFPVHVTVVHAKTGQTVMDQMFSVPKYVDLHYLSIAAHKRLRQVARQYRKDAQREAWIAAIDETVATMVRENRARLRGATDEEELVRKFLKFDPWLIAPGARSSDAIHRLQKHMPCHCNANAIWYSDTKLMMLVWDLEILEGLGLPPKSADIAIFNVKQYLPVRWIASNPKAYRDCDMPTEATFAKIDMTKDLLLVMCSPLCSMLTSTCESRGTVKPPTRVLLPG